MGQNCPIRCPSQITKLLPQTPEGSSQEHLVQNAAFSHLQLGLTCCGVGPTCFAQPQRAESGMGALKVQVSVQQKEDYSWGPEQRWLLPFPCPPVSKQRPVATSQEHCPEDSWTKCLGVPSDFAQRENAGELLQALLGSLYLIPTRSLSSRQIPCPQAYSCGCPLMPMLSDVLEGWQCPFPTSETEPVPRIQHQVQGAESGIHSLGTCLCCYLMETRK